MKLGYIPVVAKLVRRYHRTISQRLLVLHRLDRIAEHASGQAFQRGIVHVGMPQYG